MNSVIVLVFFVFRKNAEIVLLLLRSIFITHKNDINVQNKQKTFRA